MKQISHSGAMMENRPPDIKHADIKQVRSQLKVLICAYACSPSRGSEFGVGWGWVEAISKYHDLWVLTATHCREEIEAEFSRRPELRNRIRFHYIPRTRYRWAEKLWPPAYLHSYKNQWQEAAYETAVQLHKELCFDIVHQLTYVGFRVPGLLWKLDAPFVWGPIGGLEQTTWGLIPSLGLYGTVYFSARNLVNEWDRRHSKSARQAFAKADGGIIAATSGIQREIRRFFWRDSVVISEIGLPPVIRKTPTRRNSSEPISLLWCGNLLPGKALHFLLSALQKVPADVNWVLTIIGDGPSSAAWRKLAIKLGVDRRCNWLGQVSRQVVLEEMQAAHALVITSVYDLTSTVLVEALANGLPVICPDHCGFADAITSECGIKVPATSGQGLVTGIRDAVTRLDNEEIRLHLAEGALARSSAFEWDQKAQKVNAIYFRKIHSGEAPLRTLPNEREVPIQ